MTNPLTHYAIGLLVAYVLGVRDRRVFLWAWLAVVPDLDLALGLPKWLWDLVNGGSFTTDLFHTYVNGFWNHRGIMHSYVAAAVVGLLFFLGAKKIKPALVAALVYASHIYFDILDLWIVHPYLPFTYKVVMNSSAHPYYLPVLLTTVLTCLAVVYVTKYQRRMYLPYVCIVLFVIVYGFPLSQKVVVPLDIPFSSMEPVSMQIMAAVQPADDGYYMYQFVWGKQIKKQFVPKFIGAKQEQLYVDVMKVSGFQEYSLVAHNNVTDALLVLDIYAMPFKDHGWVYRYEPQLQVWQEVRIEQDYLDKYVLPYIE